MLNYYQDLLSNKIYKIAIKELSLIKRLPYCLIVGFVGDVFNKAKIPRKNPINKEYFDAIIDAIYEVFYNNIEPEFDSEIEYNKFNDILHLIRFDLFYTEFIFSPELNKRLYGISPYLDSSIPFLVSKEYVKGRFERIKNLYPELTNYNTIDDIFS